MTRTALASLLLLLLAPTVFAAADREASRAAIMIPIAGTVSGANGTRFQTDLTIMAVNPSTPPPALIDVYWLPRDVAGTGTPITRLVLSTHTPVLYEDFVTRTLGVSGLGTIILRTVFEDGTPNLAGRIDAFARIWTPVPGGRGTTSQSVHASTLYSPPTDDLQPVSGFVYGLRQDANFRSNYGLVNMSPKRLTYDVRFLAGNGTSVSETVVVEPQSMVHRPVPASIAGAVSIQVTAHQEISVINPTAPFLPWTAYGSSVDNVTGDAWYSKAQAAYPHNECR